MLAEQSHAQLQGQTTVSQKVLYAHQYQLHDEETLEEIIQDCEDELAMEFELQMILWDNVQIG